MTISSIDAMIERSLALALNAPEGWRDVVRTLASSWPEAAPTDLVIAIVEAGHAIESNFDEDSPSGPQPARLYRLAALLSLDLHAMQSLGRPAKTATDLMLYWTSDDRYFLDL